MSGHTLHAIVDIIIEFVMMYIISHILVDDYCGDGFCPIPSLFEDITLVHLNIDLSYLLSVAMCAECILV